MLSQRVGLPELGLLRVAVVFAPAWTSEPVGRKRVLPGQVAGTAPQQPAVEDKAAPAADMEQQVAVGIQVRWKRASGLAFLASVAVEHTVARLPDNTVLAVAVVDRDKVPLDKLVEEASVVRDNKAKVSTRPTNTLARKAGRMVGRMAVKAFRSTLAAAAKQPMR